MRQQSKLLANHAMSFLHMPCPSNTVGAFTLSARPMPYELLPFAMIVVVCLLGFSIGHRKPQAQESDERNEDR